MLSESASFGSDMTSDAMLDSLLEFGFDFSSDLFDSDGSISTPVSEECEFDTLLLSGSIQPVVKAKKSQTGKVAKSSSNSAIVASKGKVTKSQALKGGSKWLEKAEQKAAVAKLYAFPSFDRSDSIIFMPTSLCRLMNSGDIPAISKLIRSHFSKTCEIKMSYWNGPSIDVNFLLKMYQMLLEVHPDSIQVAQNIKVDGNKITASIFAKHTDNRAIHDAVHRTTDDPVFMETMRKGRIEELHQFGNCTEEEMTRYEQIVSSHDDLLMYFHLELEYIIDDLTKKVSQFTVNGKITAIEPTGKAITSY